jgi:diguanylate cyclase (GGDEF)-like protein
MSEAFAKIGSFAPLALTIIGFFIALNLHIQSKQKLEAQKLQLDSALNNMSQGLLMFDSSERLVVCNSRYIEMYRLSSQIVKPGCLLRELLDHRIVTGSFLSEDPNRYLSDLRTMLAQGKTVSTTTELTDGRIIAVSNRPMEDGGWVGTHEDVTEAKRAEQRVVHMAHHDTLTGLPNRVAFNERFTATLERAATGGEQFAILSVDLDRFKEANDIYGHSLGDALLREVAHRLQVAARGIFLARMGGDEFALVVSDGPQPAAAAALAESLLAAFANEFEVEGERLQISLTIGVAVYPTDGTDAKTLMVNVDAALYRAKAETRGVAVFFDAEIGARLRERHALQQDLRSAIARGELLLHYQPQARMTGERIGFEALLRWRCPKRGMVSPSTFIPIAEESGLIMPIGEWVLREASRDAASWPQPLTVAVNISPIQFHHGDLPRLVHSILLETGLVPSRLELEITEGVFINDFSHAVSVLRRLKLLGVQIALDDFGTGYSSLSYLHSFPFDKIKIDRTFIGDLNHNRHSMAIVRAVINLGHSLTMPVLAEGIETQVQHALLVKEGCDEAQGYLIGRPLPIAEHAELVGNQAIAKTSVRAAVNS